MTISSTNKPSIILKINDESCMIIRSPRPIQQLHMCDCAPLILEHPEIKDFIVTPFSQTNPIFDILMRMGGCFEDALNGNLRIDHIQQSVGIIRCEGLHYTLSGKSPEYDFIKSCVIASYPNRHSTFLYEKSGEFFLEIAPLYPWEFCEPEPGEQYYSYETFMASYMSIFKTSIERSSLEKIHSIASTICEEIIAREYSEGQTYDK